MKVWIDNISLKEKEVSGFKGLKVKYELNDYYFGYLTGSGYSLDTSNLKLLIKSKVASEYIKRKFKLSGFDAKIKVTIEDNNQKSELYVDTTSISEVDCCYVEIQLVSNTSGISILNREKVEYPILLSETITVPIRDLPLTATWKGETIEVTDSFNHTVPLTVTDTPYSGGTSTSVKYDSNGVIFTSNQQQDIIINGEIKHSVQSNEDGTYDIILKYGQVGSYTEVVIDTFDSDDTLTENIATISESLTLNSGDTVQIIIKSTITGTSTVLYNADSTVTMQRASTTAIVWKDVKAVSVRSAFDTLIKKATNSELSLGDYIFDECLFDGYITNNNGLVNETSTVTISFYNLWEELNNKYPIALEIVGNKINIISRCEYLKCPKPKFVKIKSVSREINSELLYSSIKVGYNNWKPDSKLGYLEHNSTRQYQTNTTSGSKSLSLLSDWSTSSYIISEQIQKEKSKEEIHWIEVIKSNKKAETNEYINANIYQSDRAINLRITPTRNLKRWAKFIPTDLEFNSGTGNYTFESTDTYECGCHEGTGYVDENGNISEPNKLIGIYTYKIKIEKCSIDINSLFGCVAFDYCGVIKKAFITLVEYEQDANLIEIEAIELA